MIVSEATPATPATACLDRVLADVTIEAGPRDAAAAHALARYFPPGSDVYIPYVPGEDHRRIVAAAAALRKAGFNPVPHVPARSLPGHAMLADYLAGLAEAAAVTRVLVIGGDVAVPRGAFNAAADVLASGLLQAHGICSVGLAGHPEGHPAVAEPVLEAALDDKLRLARAAGLEPFLVTQFCFEAEPIAAWLERLAARGVAVPVRVGVAGPANPATLLRFAMRCGVGNSVRALRSRGGAMLRLLGEATPDALLDDLARRLAPETAALVAGLHVFAFGGVARAGAWAHQRSRAPAAAAPPSRGRG